MLYNSSHALELLRLGSGLKDATFRHSQEEAIRHIVEGRGRLLVVQRTGWGKSFVYFIATKLLREQGHGPTLLISPLLSLMRNQLLAALLAEGQSIARIGADAAPQVGQREGGLAVAAIGRSKQGEQRLVLVDRHDLAVA